MPNATHEDSNTQVRFLTGEITYFGANDLDPDNKKPSLFFKGAFDDDKTPVERFIKLSRRVLGYAGEEQKLLERSEYPAEDRAYKGSIQVESWEWDGHNCLRVLAFKIDEDLGKNPEYKTYEERSASPFL